MKFEDRSHEETERQQRCAQSKAWNLAKNVYKLKEKEKAAFYFPAEECVLPAASTKEPEEREFVVDSAASMHVVSGKDLNSAELETMRTSRSPTTVMTVNGKVQTREETTENVKQLDLFCRQDTHSQYTSVQYSLFTSAERTSRAWLKGKHGSRIALSSLCA